MSLLATVAIPAFSEYIYEARSSEAILNLNDLVRLQTEYVLKHQSDAVDLGLLITTNNDALPVGGGPNWHHPYKSIADYNANCPGLWDRGAAFPVHPNLIELGFSPTGNLHYTYGMSQRVFLGVTTLEAEMSAIGDVDRNGVFGRFSRLMRLDPNVRVTADAMVSNGQR